jgi:hypothetical protein
MVTPMDLDLSLIHMMIKVSLESGRMGKNGTQNILKKMEH